MTQGQLIILESEIKSIKYGEVKVIVRDGKPTLIEKKETTKLD